MCSLTARCIHNVYATPTTLHTVQKTFYCSKRTHSIHLAHGTHIRGSDKRENTFYYSKGTHSITVREHNLFFFYLAHGTHARPLVSVFVVHHNADLFRFSLVLFKGLGPCRTSRCRPTCIASLGFSLVLFKDGHVQNLSYTTMPTYTHVCVWG